MSRSTEDAVNAIVAEWSSPVFAEEGDSTVGYKWIALNREEDGEFDISEDCVDALREELLEFKDDTVFDEYESWKEPKLAVRSHDALIRTILMCERKPRFIGRKKCQIDLVKIRAEFCNDRYCKIVSNSGVESLEYNFAQCKLDQMNANSDDASPSMIRSWYNMDIMPAVDTVRDVVV